MNVKVWVVFSQNFINNYSSKPTVQEEFCNVELKEVTYDQLTDTDDTINGYKVYSYNTELWIDAKATKGKIKTFSDLEDDFYRSTKFFGFEKEDTKEKMLHNARLEINKYIYAEGTLLINLKNGNFY